MKRLFVLLSIAFLPACNNQKKAEPANLGLYYTCSMNPQVMQEKPGNCPICGMKLIPVSKGRGPGAGEIKLSDQQMLLGNIHVDTIRSGMLGDELVLTATLNFDQMKVTAVSARVMGRVDHLYFKNIGDYVKKGDKLFDLYSEELNNAKQEYLLDRERQNTLDNSMIDFKQLLQAARNKLLLWGMSESQITELERAKKADPTTSFYSTESGHITTLDIREGDYVMEGGTILRLADLSRLWAEAQVYTSQLYQLDKGGTAIVRLPDMPQTEIRGNIEFVNPEITPDTRINLIRVSIPNKGNQLKPGMPAYVIIKNKQQNVLQLPADAVIRDEKGASVWVQTGLNTFKNKMVITGLESDDRIEIKSGLNAGDVIVVTGAYLLNSEYIFRKGANPMAGHDMGNM